MENGYGYHLGNFCVDEPRRIKVVAIGAGYSGITAGIRFRQRVQNLDFTIYESHAGVGGTWYSNRYPGLACDIPSHCYQLTFEENPNWSQFYAPGHEIQQYLEGVATKYGVLPYIKFEHRVVRADYNESSGKWHLTIKRRRMASELIEGISEGWEEFEDTTDVLFIGVGALSRWVWPDIQGLESFQGKVIHTAQWETGEGGKSGWEETVQSWSDKKVGVIGIGSSAIQVVPSLQPRVKKVVNYGRGKTWVSATFLKDALTQFSGTESATNYTFTEKDKLAFNNPTYYKEFRHKIEHTLNSIHIATMLGSSIQQAAQREFKSDMIQRLAKKPWIADHLIPEFSIGCRRLTPGPGYLEALCEDNVDFITSPIQQITPSGITTEDGNFQELDIIVCATGYDTSHNLDFSIVGRGGIELKDHHNPHPRTYLSVAVDGFPNMFQSQGPNSAVGAGSLLILIERQVDYAVAATLKIQRERLKSMDVKSQAIDDFDEYLDSYFPKTVFGQKCRSWYKVGKEEGRIVALWPGSPLHAARTLTHPRWEDYNYELLDGEKNRFYWLGDGNTMADKNPLLDKAWYLNEVDHPPITIVEDRLR